MRTKERSGDRVIAFTPFARREEDEPLELLEHAFVFSLAEFLDFLGGERYVDGYADEKREEAREAPLAFGGRILRRGQTVRAHFGLRSEESVSSEWLFDLANTADEPERELAVSPREIWAAAGRMFWDICRCLGWRYEGPPERRRFFEYRLATPPTENYRALRAFVKARRISTTLREKLANYYGATRYDPCFGEAYYAIAYILKLEKKYAAATHYYRLASENLIDARLLSAVHAELGLCLAYSGKTDEAIREWRTARRWDRENIDACLNLAAAYKEKKDAGRAITYLKRAKTIDPDSYWACHGLTHLYVERQEWDKAIAEAKRLTAIAPKDAEAHYLLGFSYANKLDFAQANKHLELATKLDPKGEIAKKAFRVLAQLGK